MQQTNERTTISQCAGDRSYRPLEMHNFSEYIHPVSPDTAFHATKRRHRSGHLHTRCAARTCRNFRFTLRLFQFSAFSGCCDSTQTYHSSEDAVSRLKENSAKIQRATSKLPLAHARRNTATDFRRQALRCLWKRYSSLHRFAFFLFKTTYPAFLVVRYLCKMLS